MTNETPQNPFDIMSLATGDDLFGRGDELSWLVNGIREQARLLLFGGEGMGKSSLVEQAGKSLAQGGAGWMIRLDLSLHRGTDDLVSVLGSATNQLQRSPDQALQQGVLGDEGKRPLRGQKQETSSSPGPGRAGQSSNLSRKLDELNAFALSQGRSVVIAFDSCHEMARFGGEHFENTLRAAVENHSAMAYVLSGDEHGLKSASSSGMQQLQGAFKAQHLGPLDPKAFARHLDGRFQSAGIVTRGVGAACVDCAGSNTTLTVELAQRTFHLSFQARFANDATVQAALSHVVEAKKNRFAQIWGELSSPEHSVLRGVAKTGGERSLEPNAFRQFGLENDEQARTAIHSLVDKRLLDPAGPSGVKMHSAAMKQWTLNAQVSFGQQQKAGDPTTQQLSFSLNFQRSSNPSKVPGIKP